MKKTLEVQFDQLENKKFEDVLKFWEKKLSESKKGSPVHCLAEAMIVDLKTWKPFL